MLEAIHHYSRPWIFLHFLRHLIQPMHQLTNAIPCSMVLRIFPDVPMIADTCFDVEEKNPFVAALSISHSSVTASLYLLVG